MNDVRFVFADMTSCMSTEKKTIQSHCSYFDDTFGAGCRCRRRAEESTATSRSRIRFGLIISIYLYTYCMFINATATQDLFTIWGNIVI